jgi:hypothetical protein
MSLFTKQTKRDGDRRTPSLNHAWMYGAPE